MEKELPLWYVLLFVIVTCLAIFGFVLLAGSLSSFNNQKCKIDCIDYDSVFVKYIEPGFSSTECWCRRGNEPLRIW